MAAIHSTWFGPPTPPPSSPNWSTPSPNKRRSEERGMLRGLLGRDRDITERQRLDTLHQLHMTLLDPVHTQTIHSHLAAVHASGRRSRVLDVGAGTGAWSISLANAQPYCDVVAVDIDWSNWSNTATQYGNFDCETVNVTAPLPFPPNHFDVIHVKTLLLEVPGYITIIERLAVTLRPGGLMILVEVEPRYLSSAGQTSQTLRTWDACVRDSYAARGVDTTLPANLLHCLSSTGIFQPTAFTQEFGIGSSGFIRGDSQALARASRLHKSMIEANIFRMIPVVRANGYDEGEIQSVVRDAIAELSTGDSRHYQRIFAVYGRKVAG